MIEADGQSLTPGNLVMLFIIEVTGVAQPFRYVKRARAGNVNFDGHTYTQLDIVASGFKWDGQGTFPSPKIMLNNVAGTLTPALKQYDYFVGAKCTVITTYEQYLDGLPTSDPDQIYPPEIYTIEQPTEVNKVYVEWRLSSIIDQSGVKVPARKMLRNMCNLKYRVWNGSSFTTFPGECPYVGTSYFDENDVPTTAANDKCSQLTSGCLLRFNKKLPMSAFPGISRKHAY